MKYGYGSQVLIKDKNVSGVVIAEPCEGTTLRVIRTTQFVEIEEVDNLMLIPDDDFILLYD